MWQDTTAYYAACTELNQLFHTNMAKKFADMDSAILDSGRPNA
jgi:hypothetical protein